MIGRRTEPINMIVFSFLYIRVSIISSNLNYRRMVKNNEIMIDISGKWCVMWCSSSRWLFFMEWFFVLKNEKLLGNSSRVERSLLSLGFMEISECFSLFISSCSRSLPVDLIVQLTDIAFSVENKQQLRSDPGREKTQSINQIIKEKERMLFSSLNGSRDIQARHSMCHR